MRPDLDYILSGGDSAIFLIIIIVKPNKVQIQIPKSQILSVRKGTGTGADTIIQTLIISCLVVTLAILLALLHLVRHAAGQEHLCSINQ